MTISLTPDFERTSGIAKTVMCKQAARRLGERSFNQ
jgi:hypothetical protein